MNGRGGLGKGLDAHEVMNNTGHGYTYERVIAGHYGYDLRVTLHVDTSYAAQCNGVVEVLTPALTWTDLARASRTVLADAPRWSQRRVSNRLESETGRDAAYAFCRRASDDLIDTALDILPDKVDR